MITQVHHETHEILMNAMQARDSGEITREEYNQIVLTCFKAEQEWAMLEVVR